MTILSKKPKEEQLSKMLHSKGFLHPTPNHSKSVSKGNKPAHHHKQIKEKNISLEKHQNREVLTKTQTGFYIMTTGGVINEKDEYSPPNNTHSRNKIYNVRSPKSKGNQRRNMLTNAAERLPRKTSSGHRRVSCH